MTYRTHEQIMEDYKEKLGEEFGLCYYYAHNEYINTWLLWKQFKNLFCHGPERVELLNKCGASFFANVDRTFVEATIMGICRLGDPSATGDKENLSVLQFKKYMDTPERTKHIEELLETFKKNSKFARDWRNRTISHNDYNLKLGVEGSPPQAEATVGKINEAMCALFKIFEYISAEFLGGGLVDEVIDPLNNEMVTLDRLYLGDIARKDELDKFRERKTEGIAKRPSWLSE